MAYGRRSTDTALNQHPDLAVALTCLTLILAIATINYLVGFEFALSLLFLIPVGLVVWRINFRMGVIFSIISALVWYLTDVVFSTHQHANAFAPHLNTVLRLALFLAAAKLTDQLKTLTDNEYRHANTDTLTGLLNKGGFTELAEKIIAQSLHHTRSTTFAYIDLDNFKKTNDELGHAIGDHILKSTGETFLKNARRTDPIGRLGEDAFVLILPKTHRAGAQIMLNRFRSRYDETMQKSNWPVTFSIGCITYDLPPENLEAVINSASALMQQAKQNGKNNTVFDYFPKEQNPSYHISYDD